MSNIAIINYGVGNLFSLSSSLRYLGLDSVVTSDADEIRRAEKIILPGVGAFGDAMDKLKATGLIPILNDEVYNDKPLMGICLGMQLLFNKSYEYGEHRGLGYIAGEIVPFADSFKKYNINLKIPQMGWNSLKITSPDYPLVKNTFSGEHVYFVHSYYASDCEDAIVAQAEYGVTVPAIVAKGNVCGCQFHPEKSGDVGLNILRAFADM